MLLQKIAPWFCLLAIAFLSNGNCQELQSKSGPNLSYDPFRIEKIGSNDPVDLTVVDADRKMDLPIRVYLPKDRDSRPVILFSHGLGGSCKGNRFCGEHWSARGFVVVGLQHPGSDSSVWKDVPVAKRMQAMKEAASAQNFSSRTKDVEAVLNQLEIWNKDAKHPLFGKMDLTRVGMSGHSFGAHTTQALGGQSFPIIGQRYFDPRIQAALALSPNVPPRGDLGNAFGKVSIPWLLMTGTKDSSPIGNTTPEQRTQVYPNLPTSIDKFQLILQNAEHSAFADSLLPGEREKRNPNHHRAILGLSTAFWDAYLLKDTKAKEWLLGEGAKSILENQDKWEVSPAAGK